MMPDWIEKICRTHKIDDNKIFSTAKTIHMVSLSSTKKSITKGLKDSYKRMLGGGCFLLGLIVAFLAVLAFLKFGSADLKQPVWATLKLKEGFSSQCDSDPTNPLCGQGQN